MRAYFNNFFCINFCTIKSCLALHKAPPCAVEDLTAFELLRLPQLGRRKQVPLGLLCKLANQRPCSFTPKNISFFGDPEFSVNPRSVGSSFKLSSEYEKGRIFVRPLFILSCTADLANAFILGKLFVILSNNNLRSLNHFNIVLDCKV